MIKKIVLISMIILFSISIAYASNIDQLDIPHDFSGKKVKANFSYQKPMIIRDF